MRKILYLLLLFVLSSCNTAKYVFVDDVQNYGLDLSKGKWILNEIDCPSHVYGRLNTAVNENFKDVLSDSLFNLLSAKGLIFPKKIALQPSKLAIQNLKKGAAAYDYLINIRAAAKSDQLGSINLMSEQQSYADDYKKNQSEVIVEVYDLNLAEIIYAKKVIGTIDNDKKSVWNNANTANKNITIKDVNYYASTDMIILGGFDKIMKDIKNKSVKQKKV